MNEYHWIALVPTALAVVVYSVVMLGFVVALRRGRRRATEPARAPVMSILKPLAGRDDDLEENLESFARLDYPDYELLFGVASMDDAAFEVARRFVARHPELRARVVVTDPHAAVNPKVAQLIALDRQARGEVIVVSDSNVRVKPDYLWSLASELEQPGVGLVTSLFAGTGERTIGAALENLQLGTMIAPGIAVAAMFAKRPFTVGKSMAMRRRDLVVLGGFARVGHVLAEDHLLGRLFHEAGFEIRTSLSTVENRNVDCGLRRSLERHTRWAKMRRGIAPTAFAFEPLLTPLSTATLVALVFPSKLALAAVLATALLQTAVAFVALRVLRGRTLRWHWAPLEIVRSYVILFCWLRACVSRRIEWRGNPFVVGRDSVITPVALLAQRRSFV